MRKLAERMLGIVFMANAELAAGSSVEGYVHYMVDYGVSFEVSLARVARDDTAKVWVLMDVLITAFALLPTERSIKPNILQIVKPRVASPSNFWVLLSQIRVLFTPTVLQIRLLDPVPDFGRNQEVNSTISFYGICEVM